MIGDVLHLFVDMHGGHLSSSKLAIVCCLTLCLYILPLFDDDNLCKNQRDKQHAVLTHYAHSPFLL